MTMRSCGPVAHDFRGTIMKRTSAMVSVLLVIMLLCFTSCGKKSENTGDVPSLPEERTLRMAIVVDPDGLDPHMTASASTFQVTSNIFETLVTVDTQGNIIPCLADGWDIAEDGMSITFHLREDAAFSDGRSCLAEDVVASFERLLSPSSTRSADYKNIKEIIAVDDHTVTFSFNDLEVTMLSSFAYPWSAVVDVDTIDTNRPLGTGPYFLKSWVPQQDLKLQRNPFYTGTVNIDDVEFMIMPELTSQITALRNREVDIILITGDLVSALDGVNGIKIQEELANGLQLMAMNCANEDLADIRVRQAINYAVDRDALIEAVWFGYGRPINTHFPLGLAESAEIDTVYPYDPDKARSLLSEAGYAEGELTLDLFLPRSYQEYVNAGLVIAEMLKNVGINVNVEIVEWATWLSDVYNGRKYDLTVVGHTGRLDAYALLKKYESTGKEDYFNYENERVDELLGLYTSELDADVRKGYAFEIEKILSEEVPALYIQDPVNIYAMRDDVSGWNSYPINIYRMQDVSFTD